MKIFNLVNNVPKPVMGGGTLEEQRSIYSDVVSACLAVKGCTGVTLWGISDAYTWWKDVWGFSNSRPLPFDEEFRPKPAYYGILGALLAGMG